MKNITVAELKKRIIAGENLNLIDVRESEERAEFNIGGTHLPLGNVMTMQIDSIEHLKNQEVICYCRSGKRSLQASMMLESMGFTNISNLEGGVLAWQQCL